MEKFEKIIKKLDLKPHPEGGYFKETYRSSGEINENNLEDNFSRKRNYSTCIYFLLTSDDFSAFHKIKQDEIWHFYDGDSIELYTISEEGEYSKYIIGKDFEKGEIPQLIVPKNHWFGAKTLNKKGYSLVGCTVSPGFDFSDFELAKRDLLINKFPKHKEIIIKLTNL